MKLSVSIGGIWCNTQPQLEMTTTRRGKEIIIHFTDAKLLRINLYI